MQITGGQGIAGEGGCVWVGGDTDEAGAIGTGGAEVVVGVADHHGLMRGVVVAGHQVAQGGGFVGWGADDFEEIVGEVAALGDGGQFGLRGGGKQVDRHLASPAFEKLQGT